MQENRLKFCVVTLPSHRTRECFLNFENSSNDCSRHSFFNLWWQIRECHVFCFWQLGLSKKYGGQSKAAASSSVDGD